MLKTYRSVRFKNRPNRIGIIVESYGDCHQVLVNPATTVRTGFLIMLAYDHEIEPANLKLVEVADGSKTENE